MERGSIALHGIVLAAGASVLPVFGRMRYNRSRNEGAASGPDFGIVARTGSGSGTGRCFVRISCERVAGSCAGCFNRIRYMRFMKIGLGRSEHPTSRVWEPGLRLGSPPGRQRRCGDSVCALTAAFGRTRNSRRTDAGSQVARLNEQTAGADSSGSADRVAKMQAVNPLVTPVFGRP